MYTIYCKDDGTFACEGRLQDGTERWTEATLKKAVDSLKQFAKAMNGTKIARKDIAVMKSIQVVETKWVLATGGK